MTFVSWAIGFAAGVTTIIAAVALAGCRFMKFHSGMTIAFFPGDRLLVWRKPR